LERKADHSLPSTAEAKNAWSYTSTRQYAFMAWCSFKKAQGQLYLYFTFTFYTGPKIVKITDGWRQQNDGEFHSLYSSPNIIRVTKSGRLRWAGHVVRTGEIKMQKRKKIQVGKT
jgi:hypothetical protein